MAMLRYILWLDYTNPICFIIYFNFCFSLFKNGKYFETWNLPSLALEKFKKKYLGESVKYKNVYFPVNRSHNKIKLLKILQEGV